SGSRCVTAPVPLPQVQDLEQQNKVLTTRWNFLKEQDNSQSDADVRAIYEQFMGRMSQERKALSLEQENLERELEKVLGTMDAFRSKWVPVAGSRATFQGR
ncbi:keratin, type II cytoskeletal 80-like, partial [Corapipo altera]|uniref:keratin, type II cytoskeletal 80-like n=1 Tax=Corapipo altera TaxID=415028 RepID=UPI000FD664B0